MIDWPYVILILLLLIIVVFAWKNQKKKYFYFASALVFLFLTLRAPVVGADTWNYYRYLTGLRNWYNEDTRELEPLFLFYRGLMVDIVQGKGLVVMAINTFVSFVFIYKLVDKFSCNKTLSVLLFFLIFSYNTYFVALRQTIGLSILFCGILYFAENKKHKWIVLIGCGVIGYYFHTSVIVNLIMLIGIYFLPTFNRKTLIFLMAGTMIVGIVLQRFNFMVFFDAYLSLQVQSTERLNTYLENVYLTQTNSSLNVLGRPTIIGTIIVAFLPKKYLSHWFTKIYVSSICAYNLLYQLGFISRIIMGFSIFGIIIFTWILDKEELRNNFKIKFVFIYRFVFRRKQFVNWLAVIFVAYFLRAYILAQIDSDLMASGCMHPYQFWYEDYSKHPSITVWGENGWMRSNRVKYYK